MSALMPNWDEEDTFTPTPGGILDGLPDYGGASGLDLIMSPEEIAGIDGLVKRGRPVQDSEPRPLEVRDNSLSDGAGDKSSEQPPRSNGIVDGDNKGPPQNPLDKAGEGHGNVAGKIWNSPNSAVGMAYGGLGYLAGWPMHWLGLQKDAPGITTGNNSVQFTDNPFIAPDAAITLGNVEVFGPREERDGRNFYGPHEEQHTYQGEQLGPLYLPSNVLGGAAGELFDRDWHGPHNWNEVGPNLPQPVPWPR